MTDGAGTPAARRTVATFELMPGHPTTAAEVALWWGEVHGVPEHRGPWVVLHGDDWPMSTAVARRLAAALTEAADRAEASRNGAALPDGVEP